MVTAVVASFASVAWAADSTALQDPIDASYRSNITQADREAAAQRAAEARAAQEAAKASSRTLSRSLAAPTPGPTSLMDLYYGPYPNYTNSPLPVVDPGTGEITGGIRKFVDTLPGLGPENANNLGQYIPIAKADTATYPGSDYYQIGLVEYQQQMHSDLPATTTFRGYKDLGSTGSDANPHYLGPLIIAKTGRPVRIKFDNLLPTGTAGNLFIPVDKTIMGAGDGPNGTPYSENRATLHLHGGNTPWISDGTPHQWTVPAGETTDYKKGLSTQNVPDMPDPGDGSMTFYYPNQQSGRLMFYHDHTYGLTRLNVYAGEAAGYLLTDFVEEGLIDSGVIPGSGLGNYRYGIPLIIQDKTFVPDPTTLANTDPTWDTAAWGGYGNLWLPHVYMPNQNPNDEMGMAAMGRWDYGPFFWPPYTGLTNQPITNPDGTVVPNLPNPSIVPEAFMDTPVINGAAYPTVTVAPQAYRFRILNATNDRYLNLQLYYANPDIPVGQPGHLTEVRMVNAYPGTGLPANWPTDAREGGVPDPTLQGPSFIQIGHEGGLLPAPVVITPQPINYDYDRRSVTVLNVKEHSLYLGPAERADVIVDFSTVPAGSTLILYNDAPAPVPASDPRVDYYTGNPDFTATGGAPSTIPGYGPNTRTLMQIKVEGTPGTTFDLTALENAFKSTETQVGAYAASQPPPFIPEAAYGPAFNTTYKNNYVKIQETSFTFSDNVGTPTTTISLKPKALHELFDPEYGRMNSLLGVEMPNTSANVQTTLPFAYIDPPTEIFDDGEIQYWKLTHNGVDTHAIHFHLFNVQVVNRVGWDGSVRAPDPEELGWKDTVKMNPLEDIVVAAQALKQNLPWGVPKSVRPLDVTRPLGSTMGFTAFNEFNQPVSTVNSLYDFDWEYVWHCHLLGHEENDMMRPIVMNVIDSIPEAPTGLSANLGYSPFGVTLNWADNSLGEIKFIIERATGAGAFQQIGTALANKTSFLDSDINNLTTYKYRVLAYNTAGNSDYSNEVQITVNIPAATGATLTSNVPRPQLNGTTVTFTGAGAGGAGFYEYQYILNGPATGNKNTVVRPYSTTATWAWNTTIADVGTSTVYLYVRSIGRKTTLDASTSMVYYITSVAPATGATLTANPVSPKAYGTSVTFTGGGVGGTGTYEYQFYLKGPGTGNNMTVVRPYSTTATWTWDTTLADVGTSTVYVYVRSLGNTSPIDAQKSISYTISSVTPATGATISSNLARPRVYGTSIVLTGGGVGGSGTYEYQFLLKGPATGNVLTVVRPYSTTSTWTWDTTIADVGTSTVYVYVRSQGSTAAMEASANLLYYITNFAPATGATLTSNLVSPRGYGTAITFTGGGSGGTGTYEYQFLLKGPATGDVNTVVRPYSTTATWTWNTALADVGSNTVTVYVRSQGNTAPLDAQKSMSYSVTGIPTATGATLTSDLARPRIYGTSITFTGGGSGGTGTYEYQFLLNGPSTGNVNTVVRAYSTTSTWTWNTTLADIGTSTITVRVRSQGSTVASEATTFQVYYITANAPATGATLTSDLASPSTAGTPITFTGGGIGGTGTYEYQFYLKGPATGNAMSAIGPYSTTATWTWNTTTADIGTSTVYVYVRSQGNTAPLDAQKSASYTISP